MPAGLDRDGIIQALGERGVPCFSGSCSEVYREKAFRDAALAPAERLSVARRLGKTSIMLLVHPPLTEAEIHRTCAALREVLSP